MFYDITKASKLFAVVDVIRTSDLTLSFDLYEPLYDDRKLVSLRRIVSVTKGVIKPFDLHSDNSFVLGQLLTEVVRVFNEHTIPILTGISTRLNVLPINRQRKSYWMSRSIINYSSYIKDSYSVWHYKGSIIGAPKWINDRLHSKEFTWNEDSSELCQSSGTHDDALEAHDSIVRPNHYILYNESTNIIRILSEDAYKTFVNDHGMSAWMDNH